MDAAGGVLGQGPAGVRHLHGSRHHQQQQQQQRCGGHHRPRAAALPTGVAQAAHRVSGQGAGRSPSRPAAVGAGRRGREGLPVVGAQDDPGAAGRRHQRPLPDLRARGRGGNHQGEPRGMGGRGEWRRRLGCAGRARIGRLPVLLGSCRNQKQRRRRQCQAPLLRPRLLRGTGRPCAGLPGGRVDVATRADGGTAAGDAGLGSADPGAGRGNGVAAGYVRSSDGHTGWVWSENI